MNACSFRFFLIAALIAFVSCSRSSAPVQPAGLQASGCGPSDGACPEGCTFYDDSDCPKCSPSTGLTAPVRPCSPETRCVNLLGLYESRGIAEITTPTDVPECKTGMSKAVLGSTGCVYGGRGDFNDQLTGSPHSWSDEDGTPRYWCEFSPAGTTPDSRRPLVIFIHGSGGSADDVYNRTLLRAKAAAFDLSGDPHRPGFILVSVQGRNLHWPSPDPQDGSKHDSVHRNTGSNGDVGFFDHLIDRLTTEGVVDPKRIYVTGWSNGARFAAFYGITRHADHTPGGNRVAAIALYSGGDPYENLAYDQTPSCRPDPYPATAVPILLISRNCDLVACSQEQFDFFAQNGWTMAPGNQADAWTSVLREEMGDPNVRWTRIGYDGQTVNACLPTTAPAACTQSIAARNHLCWPDGISDAGGNDRELDMLAFFRANPLP